ncbi:hypothetical protein ABPG72_006187 [Tetrahymena utriculariae]
MADQEQYKDQFLQTASNLRQTQELQQLRASQLANTNQFQVSQQRSHIGALTKITNTNDIWSSNQYSDDVWRKKMQTSFYNNEHNEKQFEYNTLLNPEIGRKDNYMRVTRISEYSNALHNNRVFINPKFTSC